MNPTFSDSILQQVFFINTLVNLQDQKYTFYKVDLFFKY